MEPAHSQNWKSARDVALICFFVLVLTIPFLGQAYHLDDQEFLNFASVQLEHPLQFFLTNHDYMGYHFDVFRTTHPPMLSSILATAMWLSGGTDEKALHASYLIFPLIAAVSMYFLGRRFCRHPLAASMLLVSTTGFLVMAHTLRGDVPGVAMWLLAITVYVNGVDRRNFFLLAAAGALIAVATLTSYQSLSLIPLLLVYSISRKRLTLPNVMPLIATAVIFLLYSFFLRRSSGYYPGFSYDVVGADFSFGMQDPLSKLRALIAFTGLAGIFPLALLAMAYGSWRRSLTTTILFLVTLALLVAVPYLDGRYTDIQLLWLLAGVSAGLASLFLVFSEFIRSLLARFRGDDKKTDQLFLGIWILGVLTYCFLFPPSATVRHLLPLFPPLVLAFVRWSEDLFSHRLRYLNIFLGCSIVLTLALALPAAVADNRLANSYREAAERFTNEYAGSGSTVWFQGEFGFRYYMERSGFTYLGVTAQPRPGDILIRSETSSSAGNFLLFPPPDKALVSELNKFTVEDSFPVRIRTPRAQTGFFSHRMGPVPIAISDEALDEYTVYQYK